MTESYDFLHVTCTEAVTQDMLETIAMIRLVDAETIGDAEILVLIGKTRRSDDVAMVRKIIKALPFVSAIEGGQYRVSDVSYQGLADAAVASLKPRFHGRPEGSEPSWSALQAVFSEGGRTLPDYASRLAA